jgi:hypothetical protein
MTMAGKNIAGIRTVAGEVVTSGDGYQLVFLCDGLTSECWILNIRVADKTEVERYNSKNIDYVKWEE